MTTNPHSSSTQSSITWMIISDFDSNQAGDLMLIQKPQTSVWGNQDYNTVASERRFMVVNRFIIALLFTITLLICTPSIEARKIRTKHNIPKQSEKLITSDDSECSDSIISLNTDSLKFVEKICPAIRFYGFDKTVTSSMESFFISNFLDTEISGMEIQITYFDMQGRQLHKRNILIDVKVPPHETIRTDIKSWDTQKSFYFYNSVKPKRQATPFTVKITLISLKYKGEASQPPH